MSTTAPTQLDPDSLDASGISVATGPAGDNPRSGAVFDPVGLAAAAPIFFMPQPGGNDHLMVTARGWSAATPGGGADVFGSWTETTDPGWYVVNGINGTRRPVPGYRERIPTNTLVGPRTLTSATSFSSAYLYLLYATTYAGEDAALIQLQRVGAAGVVLYLEEVAPTLVLSPTVTVVFDKGVRFAHPYLSLYGTGPEGQVFEIRKRWGELGTSRAAGSYTPRWEYGTGTGFSFESDQAQAYPYTSAGSLSFAMFKHITLMSTITPEHEGQVWQSTMGRPFKKAGPTISLGDSGEYLGHGVVLQPQLEPNPAAEALVGKSGGVPYVVTTQVSAGEESSLVNTWNLHTIQL